MGELHGGSNRHGGRDKHMGGEREEGGQKEREERMFALGVNEVLDK